MTTTVIGSTTDKVVIGNTADDSGNTGYRLYLPVEVLGMNDALQAAAEATGNGGVKITVEDYILNPQWQFNNCHFKETDWLNLIKALAYWRKNNKLLYLTVTPEGWTNSAAKYFTAAQAALLPANGTATDLTGTLKNLRVISINANEIIFSLQFSFASTTGS